MSNLDPKERAIPGWKNDKKVMLDNANGKQMITAMISLTKEAFKFVNKHQAFNRSLEIYLGLHHSTFKMASA